MAEGNGHQPWFLVFREAWLHVLVSDFAGAQRLCESIIHGHTDVPPGQPIAISRLAEGHVAFEQGRYEQATACFKQILDVSQTPKFFLHWYWRLQAQLGLTEVWLADGNLIKARSEAASLLEAARKTAEPTLLARAWEIGARVALAADQQKDAYDCIQNAVAIVQRSHVPLAAWLVHATAADLCVRGVNPDTAGRHRDLAAACIRGLASSLDCDQALRTSLLTSASVRRVLC
jgi:tetratricopeptide (TPR) repeat protein